MEIEISERKDNPFLKRIEVRFVVKHEGLKTPSREVVKKLLAKELDKEEGLMALEYIKSEFGKNESRGYAKIYENDESMRIEKSYLFKRGVKEEKNG